MSDELTSHNLCKSDEVRYSRQKERHFQTIRLSEHQENCQNGVPSLALNDLLDALESEFNYFSRPVEEEEETSSSKMGIFIDLKSIYVCKLGKQPVGAVVTGCWIGQRLAQNLL